MLISTCWLARLSDTVTVFFLVDHPTSTGDNLIFVDAIALYPDEKRLPSSCPHRDANARITQPPLRQRIRRRRCHLPPTATAEPTATPTDTPADRNANRDPDA